MDIETIRDAVDRDDAVIITVEVIRELRVVGTELAGILNRVIDLVELLS